MPAAEVIAVLALLLTTTVAVLPVRARTEAVAGTAAAGAVLALGAVDLPTALTEVRTLAPVVAFLVVLLVLADACAALGLFTAVGARLALLGRGSSRRQLAATGVAAAGTTATLSLDATAVLLTPVVTSAARAQDLEPGPPALLCARLANSASLLLPVSNLTNLLVWPATGLSFVWWTVIVAPAWLVAVLAEALLVAGWCHRGMRSPGRPVRGRALPLPRLPATVLTLVLVGFAAGSALNVAPAVVAGVGAGALVLHAHRVGQVDVRRVVSAAQLGFAWLVLCWGIVVAAVGQTVVGDLRDRLLPSTVSATSLVGVALVATLAASVLNNLPATLLLLPAVAPLGPLGLLALVVGVDVGANATIVGSLANLLWRRSLRRDGLDSSAVSFTAFGLATSPALVIVCTLVLIGWGRLVCW